MMTGALASAAPVVKLRVAAAIATPFTPWIPVVRVSVYCVVGVNTRDGKK